MIKTFEDALEWANNEEYVEITTKRTRNYNRYSLKLCGRELLVMKSIIFDREVRDSFIKKCNILRLYTDKIRKQGDPPMTTDPTLLLPIRSVVEVECDQIGMHPLFMDTTVPGIITINCPRCGGTGKRKVCIKGLVPVDKDEFIGDVDDFIIYKTHIIIQAHLAGTLPADIEDRLTETEVTEDD